MREWEIFLKQGVCVNFVLAGGELLFEIRQDFCPWMLKLSWIFRKWDVGVWTGWSWLRVGTGGGHLWLR